MLNRRCRSRHEQTAAGRTEKGNNLWSEVQLLPSGAQRRFAATEPAATEPAATLKCDKVHGNMAATTPSHELFLPVPWPRKSKPLLAFWKCHPVHPEAFQPGKLKQRCKAETLMKRINLERRASILIAVWFVYEPSEEQRGTRGGWGGWHRGEDCAMARTPIQRCVFFQNANDEAFFLLLCVWANRRNRKGNTCDRCNEMMMTKRHLRFLAELINSCRAAAGVCDNQHLLVYQ